MTIIEPDQDHIGDVNEMVTRNGHRQDCTGWEDCECFTVTISREKYAALLEVAEAAENYVGKESRSTYDDYMRLREALANLEKIK